jgi:hypothetical protein
LTAFERQLKLLPGWSKHARFCHFFFALCHFC